MPDRSVTMCVHVVVLFEGIATEAICALDRENSSSARQILCLERGEIV